MDIENKVKTAEIRSAAYAFEHDISFNALDDLSNVIRTSFPDSEIAEEFSCNRTKATEIVKNVLGTYSCEQIILQLQKNKFSLIVDESIDK